jgi:hypothetical protein
MKASQYFIMILQSADCSYIFRWRHQDLNLKHSRWATRNQLKVWCVGRTAATQDGVILNNLIGGNGGGSYGGGPSVKERQQAAQLMQSTETLMKFGFMSMSMTYFSSLNMIKALRTVSAQDTVRKSW